ncbi:BRO family protein [Macrococcus psychrotolerans]|uniref:BRO family protein n=1 Tax=Macrococcus psychrotolerans TaxID=3039389 RepID=A0AAT9P796_9STAP|nr:MULTISPECIES: BRO family protein [Macrococcus]QYA32852.1 phage repressor protein [Macrococcus sp. 19Msa1099]QYA37664.1 phage repressor protein [Macrococcus caseolyticus]QYA76371.1 phage repressor protein [Macrococcus caseolyticus]
MKTEIWNGHSIRFIEVNNEWWAVGKDVTEALGLKQTSRALNGLNKDGVTISKVIDNMGRTQIVNVINEINIYNLVFKSRKPEAESFKQWIFEIIKELRHNNGLEGFQVFRMLDKQHQKEAMKRLYEALRSKDKEAVKLNMIKANSITNKAISIMYGLEKSISKDEMTPEMLSDRQRILDDVVNLMKMNERYNLDLSISEKIYESILNRVKSA